MRCCAYCSATERLSLVDLGWGQDILVCDEHVDDATLLADDVRSFANMMMSRWTHDEGRKAWLIYDALRESDGS